MGCRNGRARGLKCVSEWSRCRQLLLGVPVEQPLRTIWAKGVQPFWGPSSEGGYLCRQPAPCLAFGGMIGERAKG